MHRLMALITGLVAVLRPGLASAHEVYVLSSEETSRAFATHGPDLLRALDNPANFKFFALVPFSVAIVTMLATLARHVTQGRKLHNWLLRWQTYVVWLLRIMLAAGLFGAAWTNGLFGPEVSYVGWSAGTVVRLLLFVAAILALVPLATELLVIVVFTIFAYGVWHEGGYLFTYAAYLGATLTILFHDRQARFAHSATWAPVALRVGLAIAMIYAAIFVKLLHPAVSVAVIEKYALLRFHWLFPPDALLVVLGAGLVEITIGVLLVLGFQTRLVSLISLFYMTLSLVFFREAIWPHTLWLGAFVYLFVTEGGTWTLDYAIGVWLAKRKNELQWMYANIEAGTPATPQGRGTRRRQNPQEL